MTKSIKILIGILIITIITPLICYATEDMLNWSVEEIATYYETQGKDKVLEQNDTILKYWYNTFYDKYGEGKRIKNQNNKYGNAYTCIATEISKRGIDASDVYDFQDIESNIDYWKPSSTGSNKELTTMAKRILGAIQTVGSVVSVITLVVIGIKYMLGSIEEKAKYKETMIPYIIGCVLVFATSNIASILYNIGINLN